MIKGRQPTARSQQRNAIWEDNRETIDLAWSRRHARAGVGSNNRG
jgi:hypothetical protein